MTVVEMVRLRTDLAGLQTRFRAGGGCKMFSLGDGCACPLCVLDRALALVAEHETVQKLLKAACDWDDSISSEVDLVEPPENWPEWKKEARELGL